MLTEKPQKLPVVYSDLYYVDIGDHVFPTSKYKILKKRIESDEFVGERCELVEPEPVTDEEVLSVHTKDYIDKLRTGNLSVDEIVMMEVPYSVELTKASFTTCGGTLTTARRALRSRAAVHLGGGFHHAFADHGEGFCVLNDVAVTVKALQNEGVIKRGLIIDCDLHQGNGTAFIFQDDPTVFTFSMHQQNNYPYHKPASDVDIGLADFTKDSEYLGYLYDRAPKIINTFKPDIIIYLAGADPFKGDQLGRLSITKDGLRERDNFIFTQALNYGIPVAVTLAGGYAVNREDTVDIHYATVEEGVNIFTGEK
ncbi:MAG: histone deacetylase [Candidatus Omnitrophica bacterium]|nr:histone deacetylase [Candidatus Omnitrophota bacterium]